MNLADYLKQRYQAGLLRELTPLRRLGHGRLRPADGAENKELIDFSSNDYLALSEHPLVIEAGRRWLEELGAGAGAARLMSGSLELHHWLEEETARFKCTEAALLFGSGYLANIGVIPALAGRGDAVFTDRLNHASIYDGCRLSGAAIIRFRHNDADHLETLLKKKRGGFRRALLVVESIYSMDGDRCPLPAMASLRNRYDCLLMVDEAHATGLFGPTGSGVIEEDGVSAAVDIAMGTFGKALGSYGAYVAAGREMISFLVNRARSFIYSTALPPAIVGASLAAITLIREEPGLRRELHHKAALFKKLLKSAGLNMDLGPSQIVPILIGNGNKAMAMAGQLRKNGIYATAVRPPTVPEGTARLRFSITRHHRAEDLEEAAARLLELL